MLACILVNACASPGSSDAPAPPGRFSVVYVTVHAFGDARVGAALMDRKGRRTGWNVDRPIREIPGCGHEYGSEDGIPDENAPEDTTEQAPADTVPGGPQPIPIYHNFNVFQPIRQDSANLPGLLSEGGCELRLDPVAAGHVTLAVVGTGIGFEQCQDTTSVNVTPGLPSWWRLSWKVRESGCVVKIARTPDKEPRRPAK
jgi:hypothetical protein